MAKRPSRSNASPELGEFLSRLYEHHHRKNLMDELVDAGCNREELEASLFAICGFIAEKAGKLNSKIYKGWKVDEDQGWLSLGPETRRTNLRKFNLHKFSKKVHSFADEVEKINQWLFSNSVRAKYFAQQSKEMRLRIQQYQNLPGLSRSYAETVSGFSRVLKKTVGPKARTNRQFWEAVLINWVVSETKNKHFDKVAQLLESGYECAGFDDAAGNSTEALRRRYSRFSQRFPIGPIKFNNLANELLLQSIKLNKKLS